MPDHIRTGYEKDFKRFNNYLDDWQTKTGETVDANIDSYNKYRIASGQAMIDNEKFTEKLSRGIASFGKTALKTVGNIGFDVVISYGLQKAAEAWSDYSNMQENAIERGNKALQDYATTNQNMRTATSWIEENKERYVELGERATSLGEQGSLTDAEFEEYNQLSSQLATYLPDQITGYNSLGTAIVSVTNGVDRLNEE